MLQSQQLEQLRASAEAIFSVGDLLSSAKSQLEYHYKDIWVEGEIGQLGESLVSMAISYWQIDRREDALAINRKGVELMVEAVASEQLDEQALAVAYGNLSTMYAEEGDDAQAQSFADLASRAEATGSIRK